MSSEIYWTNEHNFKNIDVDIEDYVHKRVDCIANFSKKISDITPQLRKILKSDIKTLKMKKEYKNLTAIDGSNTLPQQNPFFTSYSVNAVAYLQYDTKVAPARFLKSYEVEVVPTSSFSNSYMHLKRDSHEMQVYLELTNNSNPDVIFMDGSINSQGIWHARVKQKFLDPYANPSMLKDLYKTIFLKNGCYWSKVGETLKQNRTIWIPKRIVGKSFITKLKKQNPSLDIPPELTNEIFSFILKPNEYLGPYPFEKWGQKGTFKARKLIEEIYTVFYKPPSEDSYAIKLEFHENFLPDLDKILTTLHNQYSIYNRQIGPLLWAHNLAKTENINIKDLNSMIQRLAILNCIDLNIKKIFQSYFSKI